MHSCYDSQNHYINNGGEENISGRKQEAIRTAVILVTASKPFQFKEINLTTHFTLWHGKLIRLFCIHEWVLHFLGFFSVYMFSKPLTIPINSSEYVIVETVTIPNNIQFSEGFKPSFIRTCMLFIHSYKTHKFTLFSLVSKDKQSVYWNRPLQISLIYLSFLAFMSTALVENSFRGKHGSSHQTSLWLTEVSVKPLPQKYI